MISSVNSNGTEYYIFLEGNSLGIVANISSALLVDSNITSSSSQKADLSSSGGNIFSGSNVKTSTYDHVTVYEIKNVNLTGLLGNALNGNVSKNLLNTSINIFAYDTSGNFIVLGQENAINDSISSHLTSKDAVNYKGYFNQSANVSLYYKFNNTVPTISYITLNATANRTYINAIPANHNDLILDESIIKIALSSNEFTNITGGKYTVTTTNNMIQIELYRGAGNISGVFKVLNTKSL
jgi:hypothetical protein